MEPKAPDLATLLHHVNDSRHLIYTRWIDPLFLPYMRDRLDELAKDASHAAFAHGLRESFVPDSSQGCPCMKFVADLRKVCKAFGEKTTPISESNIWLTVVAGMLYFVLVTDLYFAKSMSAQLRAIHITAMHSVEFRGPGCPTEFLM
ncbi:hypothetical protein BC834DRAFT_967747 [Gloeopeniophorella convolvens]|nr:hypothetical protein BC834DRAFT_967747 [Gloeopeniophorella convolvens]